MMGTGQQSHVEGFHGGVAEYQSYHPALLYKS
jgi:hypothetical protein